MKADCIEYVRSCKIRTEEMDKLAEWGIAANHSQTGISASQIGYSRVGEHRDQQAEEAREDISPSLPENKDMIPGTGDIGMLVNRGAKPRGIGIVGADGTFLNDVDIARRVSWLNSIREWQEEFVGNMTAREFVDTIMGDLLGSRVFVFTPEGEVSRTASREIKGERAMARRRTFLEERPLGIEPPREVPGGIEVSLPATGEGWHQVADWVGIELAENMVYLVTKVEWRAAENGEWNPDPRGHVRAEGRLYVSENGWREFGVRLASGEDPLSMFEGAWQLVWRTRFEFADPGVDDVTADLRVAMVGSFELPSENVRMRLLPFLLEKLGGLELVGQAVADLASLTYEEAAAHREYYQAFLEMGPFSGEQKYEVLRILHAVFSTRPRVPVVGSELLWGVVRQEINQGMAYVDDLYRLYEQMEEGTVKDRESAKPEGTREDGKDISTGESSGKAGGSKRGPQENREGGNDVKTSPRNSAGTTPKKTKVLDTRRKLAEIEKQTAKFKARLIEQMMAGDEEDPQGVGSREGQRTTQDEARYEGKDNSHRGTPNKKGKDKDDPPAEGTENAMTPPAIESGTSRLSATPKVTGACDGLWSLRERVLGWFDPEGMPKTREKQRESKEGKGTSAAREAGASEDGLKRVVATLNRTLNKNQGYLADAKKKLTFDGANITEFLIDYENLVALLKCTEEEKMDHLGQHVSLSLGRDIMAIVASSGSSKEIRNEMMRKYLKAEKMATEAELAAVQRKNYATYNDFLRAFTLVALRIPGVTDRIMRRSIYSLVDLYSGYDQLPLDVRDGPYTAMHTPVGQLQMQVTFMGFTNAVAEAQRRMLAVAGDMFPEKCEPYIDDNPVKGARYKDETEVQPGVRKFVWDHLQDIKDLLQRFLVYNITARGPKSIVAVSEVTILGFRCGAYGRRPDPAKTDKISQWPTPLRTTTEVRAFRGVVGFWRIFIKCFAKIAEPIRAMIREGGTMGWTEDREEAAQTLKDILSSDQVTLAAPCFNDEEGQGDRRVGGSRHPERDSMRDAIGAGSGGRCKAERRHGHQGKMWYKRGRSVGDHMGSKDGAVPAGQSVGDHAGPRDGVVPAGLSTGNRVRPRERRNADRPKCQRPLSEGTVSRPSCEPSLCIVPVSCSGTWVVSRRGQAPVAQPSAKGVHHRTSIGPRRLGALLYSRAQPACGHGSRRVRPGTRSWRHTVRWVPVSGEGPLITTALNYDGGEVVRLKVCIEGGREEEMRGDQRLQAAISEARDRAERRCRRDGVTVGLRVTVIYHETESSTGTETREEQHNERDSGGESEMSEADSETDLRSWNRPEEIQRHHRAAEPVEKGPEASSRQPIPRGRGTEERQNRGKGREGGGRQRRCEVVGYVGWVMEVEEEEGMRWLAMVDWWWRRRMEKVCGGWLWWMGDEGGGGRRREVVGYGGWVKEVEVGEGVRWL
ncbi:hypothetical protein CBR_g12153 [Chara braunii]|uniref:Uncharacterized protein n=1 Tax=Chara braunii TaxID=69332 RepID=A0A388KRD1_CHABU|nr:hypothetical protein CBR_g12153 [Chara braunii]|eukprot:GBG72582.1 hypothetical protein CBR_g12153 [Chara braunii]